MDADINRAPTSAVSTEDIQDKPAVSQGPKFGWIQGVLVRKTHFSSIRLTPYARAGNSKLLGVSANKSTLI